MTNDKARQDFQLWFKTEHKPTNPFDYAADVFDGYQAGIEAGRAAERAEIVALKKEVTNPPTKENPMANVYENQPDARQAEEAIKPSRFRPRYRQLTDDEKALHDALKNKAVELEELFNQVKDGRYKSLAFTSLEESVMWIVKELTA
jgi:hypothetical protein